LTLNDFSAHSLVQPTLAAEQACHYCEQEHTRPSFISTTSLTTAPNPRAESATACVLALYELWVSHHRQS